MGEKSGRAFASRGAKNLTVSNRKLERAGQLASELGAEVLRFEEREARLADWDIVVCSTSAPGTVVSAIGVRTSMKERADRPMLFVDPVSYTHLYWQQGPDQGIGQDVLAKTRHRQLQVSWCSPMWAMPVQAARCQGYRTGRRVPGSLPPPASVRAWP